MRGLSLLRSLDVPLPEPRYDKAPVSFLEKTDPNPGYRSFFLAYVGDSTLPFVSAIAL